MKQGGLFFAAAVLAVFSGCSRDIIAGINVRHLLSVQYERPRKPDAEHLAIIRYILKNTHENNIHKMRGGTENKVYVNADGRELVVDKDGNLITNSYNQGTFNYYSNEEPIKKFIFDIAPWLAWGAIRDDPTSFEERLYYYTLDLDYGIQSYIFGGANEQLEPVAFQKLSRNEKEVYYIFLHLLFNETYAVQLNQENILRLRDDGEYYYQYFHQIQEMLQVRQ